MFRPCCSLKVVVIGLSLLFMSTGHAANAVENRKADTGKSENTGKHDRSDAESPTEGMRLREEIDKLQKDIGEIQAALKRIENAMETRSRASGFSPVRIRVQGEDGRPLAGYRVEMESAQKEGRRAVATGRSDDTGIALSRALPYGNYHIQIRDDSGWNTSFRNVTVEVGATLDQVIIAPDPQERASLRIGSAMDAKGIQELPFGELSRGSGSQFSHTSTIHAPEPGENDDRFAAFPTPGKGISEVAVELQMSLEQKIEQPDGKLQTWRWTAPEMRLPLILATTGRVIAVRGRNDSARPLVTSPFFVSTGQRLGSETERKIGFLNFDVIRGAERELSFEIAAGELTVRATRIVGKAEPAVLKTLGIEDETEIWLPVKLKRGSEWLPRLLDLEGWNPNPRAFSDVAERTFSVEPDETLQVTVKSPQGLPRDEDSN